MSSLVCVIDDDADIRDILSDVLTFEGYRVLAASDGLEALELLHDQGQSCCLILLDLMMPRMNGWEFRRRQEEDPALSRIPLLLLTGAGGAARAAAELNVTGAIEKPVELDTLLEAIARFCPPPAQAHGG